LEREAIKDALKQLRAQIPVSVPRTKNGKAVVAEQNESTTVLPSESQTTFAKFHSASKQEVSEAIESALAAKRAWQDTPFVDRAGIFLRAAELVSTKYRMELLAATMLGQGKNVWQAEIDAAAELADFFRYNVGFAQQIYEQQPTVHSQAQAG
jgi:1-pyrroline-5-carboxylate dehydrogenase